MNNVHSLTVNFKSSILYLKEENTNYYTANFKFLKSNFLNITFKIDINVLPLPNLSKCFCR